MRFNPLRGALYVAGFVTWGLAVGGVGKLAAYIMQEIRETDRRNARLVLDVKTNKLHMALLTSPAIEAEGDE